jgi:hypothetical protein
MRIIRPNQLYGLNGLFGIGHSKFYKDYVEHEGGDPFIPGTRVRRLRLLKLGERAKGATDVEVNRIIEGLCAEAKLLEAPRDGKTNFERRSRGRPRKVTAAAKEASTAS